MEINRKEIRENKGLDTNELILRDYLSIARSKLANERTLLAYLRTGLMFFVSGLSLIKLFPTEVILLFLGYILIPVSLFTIILGAIRFKQSCKNVTKSYKMRKVYLQNENSGRQI